MNVSVDIDVWTIKEISGKILELDQRYGPNRSVGPVTLEFDDKEPVRVYIETQKQGPHLYTLDDVGNLQEDGPS